jgi:O-antigen/teichoic acid export membrane protein
MSRTRRLIHGAATYYASQVLILLVSLWVTPFILHRVGQHDLGLWLVGLQLLSYLALTDLGVAAVVPRATATATGQADPAAVVEGVRALLGRTARLMLWQTPAVALVAAAVWACLPPEWEALRGPIGLVMVAYVALFPLRLFQSTLQGLQDLTYLGGVQTATWAIGTGVSVGLVWAGFGLSALAWSWVASQTALHLACGLRLFWRFPDLLPRRLPPLDWPRTREHLRQGFWISLSQVAVLLLNATDVFLIGVILGPAAVVPYSVTSRLVQTLGNHAQAVLQLSLPGLTEVRVSQPPERIRSVCQSLTQSQLLVSGAVACVLLAVNAGFVTWWIGAEQFGGPVLNGLLLGALLLRHWNLTLVVSLFCFGRERWTTLTTLADGAVTVAASALLIQWYGLVGAPLGWLVGTCMVSLPANLLALSRSLDVSPWRLLAPLAGWAWRVGLMALCLGFVGWTWSPQGFAALAVTGAAVGTAYLLLMLPVVARPPLADLLRPVWLGLRARLGLRPS